MQPPHQLDDVVKDRYQIRRVIGQGGMGQVYLADDLRLSGRLCALKAVAYDDNLPRDVIRQTREQFEREATVLARLDHPNLPKVSDFFSVEERDYLVMDFVPGKDLKTLMNEAKQKGTYLPERDVLNWADQIADALSYLHGQEPSILHRDIKPSNIKLTPNNVIKLVDFGLVKILISGERTITVVQGHGSAYYTPLEQYGGDTGHTDPRSDIYSFAATIYHLLTNHPPKEARQRFLHPEGLKPMQEYNPSVSPRTQRAVHIAMNTHPDERFQTVEEFREALLGEWNPQKHPRAAMPAPKLNDVINTSSEQILAWMSILLLILSIVTTVLR